MRTSPPAAARRPDRRSIRLDFRSGGWVLLLAAGLVLGIILWQVVWFVIPGGGGALGNGRDVSSYGFDLEDCLVPRARLVAAGFAKDGLRALVDPPFINAGEMDAQRLGRGSFLTSADRVIGVEMDGAARCYPLRILIWHEVVNDTFAGVPIVVTYNPLCESAFVHERRVAGQSLTFGVSGLLYNSNLLFYDRQENPRRESLWSQMQGRAVSGPAARAGATLTPVRFALTTWAAWRALHPDTEVLRPDPALKKVYRREAYSTYSASPRLQFPVEPLPPVPASRYKSSCIGLRVAGGEWRVMEIGALLARLRAEPETRVEVGGHSISLQVDAAHSALWLAPEAPEDIEVAYGYLFAWHAVVGAPLHPVP